MCDPFEELEGKLVNTDKSTIEHYNEETRTCTYLKSKKFPSHVYFKQKPDDFRTPGTEVPDSWKRIRDRDDLEKALSRLSISKKNSWDE